MHQKTRTYQDITRCPAEWLIVNGSLTKWAAHFSELAYEYDVIRVDGRLTNSVCFGSFPLTAVIY